MNDYGSKGDSSPEAPIPDIIDVDFTPVAESWVVRRRKKPLWPALALFVLTVISTLAVGAEFAASYASNQEPFTGDANLFATMVRPLLHPHLLLLGIPFSFTLLAILLAHELGHFFACRYYGIDASYPYFIPAPNIFGTFGAVIAIRSPIGTRRALFDVGFSGPIVGFLLALPAMAYGIAQAKIVSPEAQHTAIVFGAPPLMRIFAAWFHPGVDATSLLLGPVGRAAWVGLFVTALNLLPAWQLDGGHIIYSVVGRKQRRLSIGVSLILMAVGLYSWYGWAFWGLILLVLSLRFGHPPVRGQWGAGTPGEWESLGAARIVCAIAALAMFILCFTLWPASMPR